MKKVLRISIILIIISIIISSMFLFTACTKDETRVFDKDKVFLISIKESKIRGFPFNLVVDKSSNITLRKDGIATLHIKLIDGLGALLGFILPEGALDDVYLDPVFVRMAEEYFPGFSVYDLEATMGLLERSLGLKLLGLDYEDPYIQDLFINLAENGRLPSVLKIPDGLGLEYNANYYIKDMYSNSAQKFTGIFMGKHHKDSEPFVVMDYRKTPDGKGRITWINEIIDLEIYAVEA
ncbi:MAG: hypothetical protein WCS45_06085 [Clostridia bacterium]|nr:hypothetical protein [Clostridiales bacterium]